MSLDRPADQNLSSAVAERDGGAVLEVWVVPGASRTEVTGLHDGAVRIRVAAPAEGGKANQALVNLLKAITGAEAEIIRGRNSRRKQLLVGGVRAVDLVRLVSEHVG
ncbi:MAG: DUF167 domain-containing protein [Acidimicrobiia bacterium]|nr:DUF167 domain-containing protein [Acidimicrobiia bacterium]